MFSSKASKGKWWLAGIAVVAAGLAATIAVLQGGDGPSSSLSQLVVSGDYAAVETLLGEGVEPDAPRVHGFTPLARAALRNDAVMVETLLSAGADLEAETPAGLTVIHLAAATNASRVLLVLIDAGANLRARSTNGMNALDRAADAGGVDAIRMLVAAGVDVDAPSDVITQGHGYPVDIGPTPLVIAARAGHLDSVEELLALGADINAPSTQGQTPLLAAVIEGQSRDMISVLLEAGADPTAVAICAARCGQGEGTALYWARRLNHGHLIPLLEQPTGS